MPITLLITMLLAFALSISIAVSIGGSAILGIALFDPERLVLAPKEMFTAIDKFPLAAIPFFILAGNLMETGGISRRLVDFAKSLVGGVQGGLPMTCVLTCMIFAAVSGSSVATTFAIGAILIPALIKHGYPAAYAAALQATSAELGVIIPPSIPMILFGVSAEVSIGELFIAGIGPGLLIGGVLMLFVHLYCRWKGWGLKDGDGRLSVGSATVKASFALLMPVINLAMGMITPPFGVNLFAACTVARISLDQIVRHLLPFVGVILGCVMVVTYVPQISLALRDIVYAPAVVAPSVAPAPAPSIGPQ